MKKLFTLLLIFGIDVSSKALTIQQVTVSAIENSNNLNIHMQVGNGSYFEYYNHSFEFNDGTITLNICYNPYLMQVSTIKENDFVLPDVNFNQAAYTLIVKVNFQIWNGTEYSCNNQILSDTASLSFETPLNNAVQLATQDFNIHQDKLVLYPNPATDKITINANVLGSEVEIQVTDSLGKSILSDTFKTQQPIELVTNQWASGLYFVQLTSAVKSKTFKIIIR